MNKQLKLALLALGCVMLAAGCSSSPAGGGQISSNPPQPAGGQQSTPGPVATIEQPAQTAAPTEAPATPTILPATATTATTSTNPLQALANVVTSLNGVKSFRAKVLTTPAPPNTNGEATMEVVLPDKFHMIAGSGEVIRIGNTMYIKLGPNKWTSGSVQNVPAIQDPRTQVTQLVSSGGASFSGTDVLIGKPMLVFQFNPSASGTPVPGVVSAKLWVGATDGLPYQEQATLQGGMQTTITFYDYNADIQINRPIP